MGSVHKHSSLHLTLPLAEHWRRRSYLPPSVGPTMTQSKSHLLSKSLKEEILLSTHYRLIGCVSQSSYIGILTPYAL